MIGTQHNWGKRWTPHEDALVRYMFLHGLSRNKIARALGVTADMIAGRLSKLNLRRKHIVKEPSQA